MLAANVAAAEPDHLPPADMICPFTCFEVKQMSTFSALYAVNLMNTMLMITHIISVLVTNLTASTVKLQRMEQPRRIRCANVTLMVGRWCPHLPGRAAALLPTHGVGITA